MPDNRRTPKAGCGDRHLTETQRAMGTGGASSTSWPALEAYYWPTADKPAACTIRQSREGQLADVRRPMKGHRHALRRLLVAQVVEALPSSVS